MGWRNAVVAPSCCVQKHHLCLPHFYIPANTMAESGAAGGWEETAPLFCVGLVKQRKYFSRLLEHSPIFHLPWNKSQRIIFA